MRLRLTIALGDQRPAGSAGGGTALTRRLLTVAERGDVVVNGREVGVGMVVTLPDVVDTISTRTATNVTDSASFTKDPGTLRVPRFRKPDAAVRVRPLLTGHQIPRSSEQHGNPQECPTGKTRFATAEKADEVLRWARDRTRRGEQAKAPGRVYYCYRCASWHLTSRNFKPEGRRSRRRK